MSPACRRMDGYPPSPRSCSSLSSLSKTTPGDCCAPLLAHRDLWGTDDAPNVGHLPLLTDAEQATLRLLGSEGNVRLEQERIPWDYALARLGIGG